MWRESGRGAHGEVVGGVHMERDDEGARMSGMMRVILT